jgi:hypothetical protein
MGDLVTTRELPIACNLPEPQLLDRRQEIAADLFQGIRQTTELPDGYALQFPGTDAWAAKLLEFINVERSCCSFFTFELSFGPHQGPIWLRLRGPDGVKAFIENELTMLAPVASLKRESHGLVTSGGKRG